MKQRHFLLIAGVALMLLILPCNLPPDLAEDCASQTQASGAKQRWYDGSTLVYVPAGKFLMGDGGKDSPVHEVLLDDFWIYKTKVTNGMYGLCTAAGDCTPPGPDPILPDHTDPAAKDRPVVGVTWAQADTYCKWMGGRLPTEAEWEKTARGPEGITYPWGEEQPDCGRLNFDGCIGRLTDVLDYPAGASPYEAFDLSGNAFEWVSDWYRDAYYTEAPEKNPPGPVSGEVRSVRGSSFESSLDQVQASSRRFYEPQNYRKDLGFRCVVTDAQCFAPACEISSTVEEPEAPGSTPEETTCEPPPIEVDYVTYCQWKKPYANVDPGGAEITLPDGAECDPAGGIYVCTGDDGASFVITACTSCLPPAPQTPIQTPSCPPGYVLDEAGCTCKFSAGTGGFNVDCLLSWIFNPERQCCELGWPEIGFGSDKPYCEPGYVPSACTCTSRLPPEPEMVTACGSVTVSLPVCDQPATEGCPAQYCRTPAVWDFNLCCCAIGGTCR